MTDAAGNGLLDFLPEPSFLLSSEGRILAANRAAQRLLGDPRPEGALADRLSTPADDVARYLHRAARSTSPAPGALDFRTADGGARMRTHCARLAGEETRLALRCWPAQSDEFSVLAQKVRDLNAEIGARRREKAVLQDALQRNQALARELQHRVKNNLQMMISLLSLSASRNDSPEVRRLVAAAGLRLQAMAMAHELVYQARETASVEARGFLEGLVGMTTELVGAPVDVELAIGDLSLRHETAHCLALVVSELVGSAIERARASGAGSIRVSLERAGPDAVLAVESGGRDSAGAQITEDASGLDLVKGLCRQMGGTLEPANGAPGARSVVRFAVGN